MKKFLCLCLLALTSCATSGATFVKTFENVAAMLAANPLDINTNAFIPGRTAFNDGGQSFWSYNIASAAATNAGILKPNNFSGRWIQQISTNGSTVSINGLLPSQTGNSGKLLSTDGTNPFWAGINFTNTYISNLYTTNIYVSNLYATNITAQNNYYSNIYATNITVNNLTVSSNFYVNNALITNVVQELFTNSFTTNLNATLTTNGLVVYKDGTFVTRLINVGAGLILANGSGNAGNPTISLNPTNFTSTNIFVSNLISTNSIFVTTNTVFNTNFYFNTTLITNINQSPLLTDGSVPFAGANGLLTEDNGNLNWHAASGSLRVGTAASTGAKVFVTTSDALTSAHSAVYANNADTSSTAAILFAGLEARATGVNNGSGSANYGILISAAANGTTNWALYNNSMAPVELGSTNIYAAGNKILDGVSGYAGAGAKFLSDDGTYKAGSGLGTTINSTDNYVPYRSGSTTFADSPLVFKSANEVLATNALITFDRGGQTAAVGLSSGGIASLTASGQVKLISSSGITTIDNNGQNWLFVANNLYPGTSNTFYIGQAVLPLNAIYIDSAGHLDFGTNRLTFDGINPGGPLWNDKVIGGGPGTFPRYGFVMTNIVQGNIGTGDTDFYTVPAGYRAMIYIGSLGTTNASTYFLQVKTNGTYFRLSGNSNATTNSAGTLTSTYVFEENETIAFNTTATGMNVVWSVWIFPTNSPLRSVKLRPFTGGNDTLYTVPSDTVAYSPASAAVMISTSIAVSYSNQSGGARAYQIYLVPPSGSPDSSNRVVFSPAVADETVSTSTLPILTEAWSIVVASDVSTAKQMAWITLFEQAQ